MKKFVSCICLFLCVALCKPASAQFQLTNNMKEQPKWGLSGQTYVEYYYLPDIDTYYYVPGKQFIYQSGGYWTFSSFLPKANKRYDLRAANKVVINEPGAYRYYAEHKMKYANSASNTAVQKNDEGERKNKQLNNTEKKSG